MRTVHASLFCFLTLTGKTRRALDSLYGPAHWVPSAEVLKRVDAISCRHARLAPDPLLLLFKYTPPVLHQTRHISQLQPSLVDSPATL